MTGPMTAEVKHSYARQPTQQDIAKMAGVISQMQGIQRTHSVSTLNSHYSRSSSMEGSTTLMGRARTSIQSERDTWPRWRKQGAWFVEHRVFDVVMGLVVAFNLYLIVLDTNAEAYCGGHHDENKGCGDRTVRMLNWALLFFYTLECSARVMFLQRQFLHNKWNIADAAVLLVCYVEAFFWVIDLNVQELQVIRIIRLGRMLRLVKLFKMFPSLYSMVRGFIGTMFAISWGFFFILLMLLIWAIIAVQFIHPENKSLYDDDTEWCAAAFSSVESALIYFFQTLVIGDSWGVCAAPLIKKSNIYFWLLSFAFVTIQLGITNLILAVIVDTAAQVREADLVDKAEELHKQQQEAHAVLLKMVKTADGDGSGDLTHDEILASFDANMEFQVTMRLLGFEREDMVRMMKLVDDDKSGTLDYAEFINAIAKAGKQDIGAQVMMMQLELKDISQLIQRSLSTHGLVSVDTARVLDGHPPREEALLRTVGEAKTLSKDANLDGFPEVPLDDMTDTSMCTGPLMVSLLDSSQTPSLDALDHQLRLLAQMLTDRLHAISKEAEQEVFRLACSARQIGSLNTADSSTAQPDSARSADNVSRPGGASGKAASSLPTQDVHTQQQQSSAASNTHSEASVLYYSSAPLAKDSST